MATVIIAIVVFGLVGLDVWYMVNNFVHHKGKLGCDGCAGCGGVSRSSGCSGDCSACSAGCKDNGCRQ